MVRLANCVLLVATLFGCAGCGGSDLRMRNDLKQVGLTFHTYHDQKKKGPASWDDFIAFAKSVGQSADSVERVKAAGYEVKWNVDLNKLDKPISESILAEKPGSDLKLYCDGSVQGP